jgi:hypothetical protein
MASDDGEQANQPWPQYPPQQPPSSPWTPSPGPDVPDPSDNEPDEATIARPVPPPSPFDAGGDAPTRRYNWFEPPAQPDARAADQAPAEGSARDQQTQSFPRFDQPGPAPTQQMPPAPPPGGPYQPPPYPPAPYPQQGYPQNPPYQPEAPAQSAWTQPAWSQPGHGQAPYQPDSGYPPPQSPYGAFPAGYDQYGQYQQQSYAPYAPPSRPKTRRVALWVGAAVVVVIAALAIAAFTAKPGFLGFKKVLDHTAVENTIEQGGYTNVVCNDGKNPTVKSGATFTCTADGGKRITVRITSSSGNYQWSPAS